MLPNLAPYLQAQFFQCIKNQLAFFLALDFFFLAVFLATLGASAAGLVAAADAGAAAGVAGMTGAVGAAFCATALKAQMPNTPARMILYM